MACASDDEVQLFPGELRLLVNYNFITKIGYDLFCKLKPEFFMGKLAATVNDSQLHFVPGFEKTGDFTKLYLKVVLADLETEAHLLHLKRSCALFVTLDLFSPLVTVFPPVDYLDDGRLCIGRYFYQV